MHLSDFKKQIKRIWEPARKPNNDQNELESVAEGLASYVDCKYESILRMLDKQSERIENLEELCDEKA